MNDLKDIIDLFETKPNDDWTVDNWQQWYDDFFPALRYEMKCIEDARDIADERIHYGWEGAC